MTARFTIVRFRDIGAATAALSQRVHKATDQFIRLSFLEGIPAFLGRAR
jgi:hypothetical protein